MTQAKGGRKRDAAATRAAILAAARILFTRDGYDHVGMRDVAAVVGVDAALVVRYFASKEGLFAEAVTEGYRLPQELLASGRETLGERLARYVISKDSTEDEFDPTLVLLRSAANDQAASVLLDALDTQFVRPLAEWLGGELAYQRAGLITSSLFGLVFMRQVVRSTSLTDGAEQHLVALFAPVLQSYVDGIHVSPGQGGSPVDGACSVASNHRAPRESAGRGQG